MHLSFSHDDVIKWIFSALLALCAGNSPVTSEYPSQRSATRRFDVFLINGWVKNRDAGGLRRHSAHYDAIVMVCYLPPFFFRGEELKNPLPPSVAMFVDLVCHALPGIITMKQEVTDEGPRQHGHTQVHVEGHENQHEEVGDEHLDHVQEAQTDVAGVPQATTASKGRITSLIARLMGPTWGPSGTDRTQVGPMLAPWTLLSGIQGHWGQGVGTGGCLMTTLITRFMGPTWSPPGADRTQVGPVLATWTLLSGNRLKFGIETTIGFHGYWMVLDNDDVTSYNFQNKDWPQSSGLGPTFP